MINRYIAEIFAVVLLSILLSAHAVAQETGNIAYAEGEVTVRRGNSRVAAEIGDALFEGDVVVTASGSLAILSLSGRGKVKLRGSTTLALESLGSRTRVKLQRGGVFSRVRKLAGRSGYEVLTPSAVAGVRGTEFFVAFGRRVEEESDVWLCVNEGIVEVRIPEQGEAVAVEEGEGINILGGDRITDPKFYPWTRELNWNMEPEEGDVRDDTNLDDAYTDLLDQDYE